MRSKTNHLTCKVIRTQNDKDIGFQQTLFNEVVDQGSSMGRGVQVWLPTAVRVVAILRYHVAAILDWRCIKTRLGVFSPETFIVSRIYTTLDPPL